MPDAFDEVFGESPVAVKAAPKRDAFDEVFDSAPRVTGNVAKAAIDADTPMDFDTKRRVLRGLTGTDTAPGGTDLAFADTESPRYRRMIDVELERAVPGAKTKAHGDALLKKFPEPDFSGKPAARSGNASPTFKPPPETSAGDVATTLAKRAAHGVTSPPAFLMDTLLGHDSAEQLRSEHLYAPGSGAGLSPEREAAARGAIERSAIGRTANMAIDLGTAMPGFKVLGRGLAATGAGPMMASSGTMALHGGLTGGAEGFGGGAIFGALAHGIEMPLGAWIDRLPAALKGTARERLANAGAGGASFAGADLVMNGPDAERAIANTLFGGILGWSKAVARVEATPDMPRETVAAIGHARMAEVDAAKAETASRPEAVPDPKTDTPDVLLARGRARIEAAEAQDATGTAPEAPVAPVEAPAVRPAQAAPEAPAAPREEVIQPAVEAPKSKPGRPKSADTLEAEGQGKSLAQLVRAEGGIAEGSHRLTGEIEMLTQKEAATSGLVGRKGRGKTPEQLIQAAKEAGFDMEGVSPDQFVQRLLDNVRGAQDFSPQAADSGKLEEAALRRRDEQENARFQEERERGLAESKPAPEPEATSVKNRVTNDERADRDVDPMPEAEVQSNKSVLDRAMKKMDANPDAGRDLVADLNREPRPHTAEEVATLTIHRRDLHKKYDAAAQDVIDGYESGNMGKVEEAQARAARTSDEFLALESATKTSGRESGRGLQARRMEIAEDYSLLRMEYRRRVAQGGEGMSESQRTEMESLRKQLKDATDKIDAHEAKVARREAEFELGEMATRQPPRPKSEYGKRNKGVTREAYEKTKAELRDQLSRLNVGIPLDVLPKLVKMGAYHIEAGARTFADWSLAMTEGLTDKERAKVAPHLKAAFDAARKQASDATVDKAKGDIAEGLKGGKTLSDLPNAVKVLTRDVLERGFSRGEALHQVHEILKTVEPSLTIRDVEVAFSDYGKFRKLDNDPIKVEMRALRAEMQKVQQIEDLIAKGKAEATGFGRQPLTDVGRELAQLVNEAKKKYGKDLTDPEAQLKSLLDTQKTRMRNRIADLKAQIAAGVKKTKAEPRRPTDPEVLDLRAQLDAAQKEWVETFGKEGVSPAKRLELALKSAEKSAAEWDRKLKAGDVFPAPKGPEAPVDPALKDARARRDELRAQVADMRGAMKPGRTPQEIGLASLKTRLRNENARLERRAATGDFSVPLIPKRPKIERDPEAVALEARHNELKAADARAVLRIQLANQTKMQKAVRYALEASNIQRALMTSIDLSAIVRQLVVRTVSRPIESLKAIPGMAKAFGNPIAGGRAMSAAEKSGAGVLRSLMAGFKGAGDAGRRAQERSEAEVRRRPNYEEAKKWGGVFFHDHTSPVVAGREEAYQSTASERIPLVAGSGRAFTTMVNRIRMDAYDSFRASWSNGATPTKAEMAEIGAVVNMMTGRGGKADNKFLNGVTPAIWSPRLFWSRIQLLATPLRGFAVTGDASGRTRKLVAMEYARFLAGATVLYGIGSAFGGEIETDPTHPDFGKIRFGNTRLDLMGGILQATRLAATQGDQATEGGDTWDTMARFLRTKLAPVPSAYFNATSGKKVTGEDTTPLEELGTLVTPMGIGQIKEAMDELGVPKGAALGVLSIFGAGLQTYERKQGRRGKRRGGR